MYRLKGRKRVATHINKVLHAGLPPTLLLLARSAGKVHNRAGCSECLGCAWCLTFVHLVGRTQAGEFCARRLEGGDHVSLAFEPVIRHGLDAASLVKILGERRPGCEIGQLAEVCEKNFWPRPGFGKDTVRGIA